MQENDLTTITIGWNILCVLFYKDDFFFKKKRKGGLGIHAVITPLSLNS